MSSILNEFINKNDALKLKLLSTLLENKQTTFELRDLTNQFKVSDYLIRESLDSLNNDISVLFGFNWIELKRGIIYQTMTLTRYHLYQLSRYFFELSPIKLLLEQRLISGKMPNYNYMESEYGWNTSYFFIQKNTLSTLIDLDSPEAVISAAFVIFNHYDTTPAFDHYVKTASQEVNQFLISQGYINAHGADKKRLLISIFLNELTHNQKICSPIIQQEDQHIHVDDKIPNAISQHLAISEDNFVLSHLLSALNIFDLLEVSAPIAFTDYAQPILERLSTIIMPKLREHILSCTPQDAEKISQAAARYCLKFTTNNQWALISQENISTQYFQDIYPSIYYSVETMFPAINSPEEIIPAAYLNAFILNIISIIFYYIDITKIDNITIIVNFAGSPFTNHMIEAMLKDRISHASIKFITEWSYEEGDIYLSDTPSDRIATPQVIWKKPPTISDWQALTELIIRLKKK
ncbi:hypothetical protein [Leuconostoc pseudomesenteroides]|uniref:hypothetical protein n=1 Tax=Leuconostoc pseudomesenteroides TaxID=33968 RepID=UPI0011225C9C|nr:hypothetical protein [Leuconostoc pseudomesenteroides]TOZ04923.1 hypothetical protein DIS14_06960 [Leuconostoc pseudomesenteroides]